MNSGLENLRRHLRIARLALVSDEAYREAVEAEKDREWHEVRAEQARLVRWAIDATNRAQVGA